MERKKKNKVLIIFLLLMIILGSIVIGIIYHKNVIAIKRAVVVKVNENSLDVIGVNSTSLYSVSYAKEGNIGFKQGQEIRIYFDGNIAESFPAQIHHVNKIKIVKEKSDFSIPQEVLQFYHNLRENVTISIVELTKTGICFTIKDTNEFPYQYDDTYTIYKKNEVIQNPNMDTNQLIVGNQNSTSSYLRL